MTTTNPTHTAATLAALYDGSPRKIDAIAHRLVMRRDVTCWLEIPLDTEDGAQLDPIPRYSADLNHAALLEQALAERGLRRKANSILFYHVLEMFPMDNYELNDYAIDAAIHASAKSRTIAAILAAQQEAKG